MFQCLYTILKEFIVRYTKVIQLLVPVATWSKEYVCGHSPAEIVGSNPTEGMDVCLL